jgi:hypothetical protein
VQCKTADAVAYGFFAELADAARALPWCEACMDEILPVLLHWGFAVNLQPADKPAALQVCEYGQECPRLCKAGFRACPEHLTELREVYAGKQSGASVDHPTWIHNGACGAGGECLHPDHFTEAGR